MKGITIFCRVVENFIEERIRVEIKELGPRQAGLPFRDLVLENFVVLQCDGILRLHALLLLQTPKEGDLCRNTSNRRKPQNSHFSCTCLVEVLQTQSMQGEFRMGLDISNPLVVCYGLYQKINTKKHR